MASPLHSSPLHRSQRGMAVVETMMAILIFSFGILGIVGLLAASVKNTAEARYRTQASALANQIVGEMWVADKSNAALQEGFSSPDGERFESWKERVAGALPGVDGDGNAPTITIDDNNLATVTVRWQAPGAPASHNYVLTASVRDGG